MNITPLIDYQKIAKAKTYYEESGFTEIPVPWILSYEAYSATHPHNRKEFYTLDGWLNASGEQSFIDLMLQGKRLTKHLCITPCFRDEIVPDDLHHSYFIKLELIDTNVSKENLKTMINISKKFFDSFLPTTIIPMDEKGEIFDIVDTKHNIELGSYGIRHFKEWSWVYGTGLALPRLDTVLRKIKGNN